jgi:hypothetical protein
MNAVPAVVDIAPAALAAEINTDRELVQRSAETAVKCVAARPWRDVLQVHPAADMFPLLAAGELRELADDIEKHGLAERIVYMGRPGAYVLLDGRNRLDALALLGRSVVDDEIGLLRSVYCEYYCNHREDVPDVTAWIISKNIRRRHLNPKQKRDLIAKVLTLTPEKSNRAVAKTIGVDHKTVAAVRADAERTGEIPQLNTTTGTDGKSRPAKKTTALKPPAKITPKTDPDVGHGGDDAGAGHGEHVADDAGHSDDVQQLDEGHQVGARQQVAGGDVRVDHVAVMPIADIKIPDTVDESEGVQVQVLAALLDAWDAATPTTRINFLTKARIHDKSMNMITNRIANRIANRKAAA